MSVRLSASRVAAVSFATIAVVIAGTSAAVAEPQPFDQDGCVLSLAHAGSWPGSMSSGDDTVRLVSDAFTTYLSRHGGCSADVENL
jgi:hypothetical protein